MLPVDIPNTREVDLGNNKLIAERKDPFGFWHCRLERGSLPSWFANQAFTTIHEVKKAVQRYVDDKNRYVKENKLDG